VTAESNPGLQIATYRRQDNPVSNSEMRDIQKQAAEKLRNQQGTDGKVGVGGPNIQSGAKMVSYAIKVYPNGKSQYYAGIVPTNASRQSVKAVKQRTRKFQKMVADATEPQNVAAKITEERT